MADISFNENDISTELLMPEESMAVTEQIAWLNSAPVRVTHLSTGLSAIGEGQGDQIKNKERALELLRNKFAERNQKE